MDTCGGGGVGQILGRFGNQENRIFQGFEGGQISQGQFRQLEGGEMSLLRNLERDLSDGDGLSQQEMHQLNHQANGLSQQIYRDRHDWDGGCGGGEPQPWPPIGNGGGGQPGDPWSPWGGGGDPHGPPTPRPWPPIGNGGAPPPVAPIGNGGGGGIMQPLAYQQTM